MPPQIQPKSGTGAVTRVGWHGIYFTLPPDWSVTGFSMERANGYLKVDSTGTLFVQVKWTESGAQPKPRTLLELVFREWQKRRRKPQAAIKPPDLRATLEQFLKQTEKQAKKAKSAFECKVKPEVREADGERIAHHFSWTGGGQGQGKIWFCKACGRVVIAQVVGAGRDNVGDVAAQLFGSLRDHGQDGWNTWALYDLVAEAPEDFTLKSQKLMSGYLRLDFERRGGERIALERWGLAHLTRKRFTLAEWLDHIANLKGYGAKAQEALAHDHPAVQASGSVRGLFARLKTYREALLTWRPAARYGGCVWECPENNKLFAVQTWRSARSEDLTEELVRRCGCH